MSRAFDLLGNLVIVNFRKGVRVSEKKRFAKELLNKNKNVRTVIEKTGRVKGRLRKPELKYLAGEKSMEVLYKENGCVFRFNADKTYFSPRLSSERKDIASRVNKKDRVLVLFAGVAPFSIVIAKLEGARVVSNEINKLANKYARLNVELNKVKKLVEFWDGDIKRVAKTKKEKFDVIVMPRPQLKDSFLKEAFLLSKKGTKIFYYDFCKIDEIESIKEKIKTEAKKYRKKIKILKAKKAGEIAPYKIRVRVDFKVV